MLRRGAQRTLCRAAAAAAAEPPSVRGLMAGITHGDAGLSFEEAYDMLGEVDAAHLHAWEEEWLGSTGQRLRYATREVSVIDTPADDGTLLRSLHFNDRVDVVQTCVVLEAEADAPDFSKPPTLDAHTGTHTQGLALAIALREAGRACAGKAGELRVGVLGAGACGLPGFLHEALPHARVDAVEVSSAVVSAARACFGVAQLERSARFALHEACAYAWVAAAPPGGLDVLLVDMEAGEAALAAPWAATAAAERAALPPLPLVAPPPRALSADFLAACRAALAPGGVLGVNCLGGAAAVDAAAATLGAVAGCTPPAARDDEAGGGEEGRELGAAQQGGGGGGAPVTKRLLFCGGGGGAARGADDVRAALAALPPLLHDGDAWLRGWAVPP